MTLPETPQSSQPQAPEPKSSQTHRRSLLQILALVIAVVIVIAGVVLVQRWWDSRPGPPPNEIAITVNTGEDESREITPYQICELGKDNCEEHDLPLLPVAQDAAMTIDLPQEISNENWNLLAIYDNEAYNNQRSFGPGESDHVTVPGTASAVDQLEGAGTVAESTEPSAATGQAETNKQSDKTVPRLTVVEVHTVLVGRDKNGEETAYSVAWAINTTETVRSTRH